MSAKTQHHPEPILSARGIVNRFGKQVVHDKISIDILPGEILGIAGGSGSGKSVLLKTLVGLHRPDSGEATMLRARSCVGDGNSPASAMASATAVTSAIPRNCTLPRAVSSSVPEPNSVETPASVDSWAAVIMPPGNRTRTSAPSAAWCTCSAPGQASESRARGMIHRTTFYFAQPRPPLG